MAAISFPSSPSNNQVHTVGSRSWQYNGTAWKLVPRTTDAVVEGSSNLYFTNARVASAPAVSALESRATAIESDITAIESAATTLSGRVTTAESGLSSEITRATAAEAALGTRIDNVLSNVTPGSLDSLSEVVSAFQSADSSLNGAITSLATSASSGLAAETSAREAADSALDSRLDTAESDINAIESAATTLAGRVTTAEGSLSSHTAATNNPHSVTKSQVGLGNVDNTSDANKPVSTAGQTALDGKQIKDVVSTTAPSHTEGLRWIDSNDMTEYLSYGGAWIEIDKQ
jgi:prefoldin subunit 5